MKQGVWDYYTVCFGMLLVPVLCLSGRCVALVTVIVPELRRTSETRNTLFKGQSRQLDKIKSTLLGWLDR
jgi:hypothetical protein